MWFAMSGLLMRVWDPHACFPKKDVLEGKYLRAELALDLYTIAKGAAKPPYNTPESFFRATHLTSALSTILKETFEHLSGARVMNPVLLFDAGFGGGKTHTMAALYYAAKSPEVRGSLGLPALEGCRCVVIDGSAYGAHGSRAGGGVYRTIWADFIAQLGDPGLAAESDSPEGLPSRDALVSLLKKGPTLILVDELPKYLDLVKDQPSLLEKVKHFLHALTLAVSEAENSVLIVSVAGDAYADAADEVRRELTETMNILKRKMQSFEPVKSEDIPYILKKRLFDHVSEEAAAEAAAAYAQLYEKINAPQSYRTKAYLDRIKDSYPFHPELIDVMYERLSTLPMFQRTRGALSLLANVIKWVWEKKEEDAFLISPFHVDLASPEVVNELTTNINEEKFKNAIESDVFSPSMKKAKAQLKDDEYQSHFRAPLFRRACNVIYLFSLTGAREEAKGIDLDKLVAVLAAPGADEQVQSYKDVVLKTISENFWYVERIGNRFVFKKEPTENRIIDQESQRVPNSEIMNIVKSKLQELFSKKDGRFFVEIFPEDPSGVVDDTSIKVAVLNPISGLVMPSEGETPEKVPEKIADFILHRDSRGNLREFRNNIFLMVAKAQWEGLRDSASRLKVARSLAEDPERYGIPHEKKKGLQEKVAKYEQSINDAIRSTFVFMVYAVKGGKIEAKSIKTTGIGSAKYGQDVLWDLISNVLHRVKDEKLDPHYVMSEMWPSGAQETTAKALYENMHRLPGVVMSSDRHLFEETIADGVERGLWVLAKNGTVYAPERPPPGVTLSSDELLLLPDEAAKRGLTGPGGHLCRDCRNWPCTCAPGTEPRDGWVGGGVLGAGFRSGVGYPIVTLKSFERLPVKSQLEDLQKWIESENVGMLTYAEVELFGKSDAISKFRNLVRLFHTRFKKVEVNVEAKIYSENLQLDLGLKAKGDGLSHSAMKALDDAMRWQVQEFTGRLTIENEEIQVDSVRMDLANALGDADQNTKLALKLKPKCES